MTHVDLSPEDKIDIGIMCVLVGISIPEAIRTFLVEQHILDAILSVGG